MKWCFYNLILLSAILIAKEELKKEPEIKPQIVIEAEQSIYNDGDKKSVVFEGAVKLDNGQMKMVCDKLWVYLNKLNKPKYMVAKGDIIIIKEGIIAKAGELTYDVEKQFIVLKDNPQINQEGHIIRAKIINYELKTNKISTPKVRAVFENE